MRKTTQKSTVRPKYFYDGLEINPKFKVVEMIKQAKLEEHQ